MPNWCSCHIHIRGGNRERLRELQEKFDQEQFCQAVLPIPESLLNEDVELGKAAPGPDAEGYLSAYTFCVERWGTKWDVSLNGLTADWDSDHRGWSGYFDTAWAPPMGIVKQLIDEGFDVTLYYHESGMQFIGKYEQGVDACYDYGGADSKTVRQMIGDELDDFFGISDMLAEYEDEDEELSNWIVEGVSNRENN